MTQWTEAMFKVFNRSNATIFSTFQYNNVDFNVGGTYDTSTYEYTIENTGSYLMGYSYSIKKTWSGTNLFVGASNLLLTRGDTTYTISHTRFDERCANTTISNCFVYRFEVNDKLKIVSGGGQPQMNASSYEGDNILNSWWGIKLNY